MQKGISGPESFLFPAARRIRTESAHSHGSRICYFSLWMKIEIDRQITVALENKPGQLAGVCALLFENAINIGAISVIDSIEQGVIRLMVSEPAKCKALLHSQGFYVIEAEVLVIDLTDRRGKLAQIASKLASAKINIDYIYGSVDHPGAPIRLILKPSDLARAREVLKQLED
jgi:hypothetical protein